MIKLQESAIRLAIGDHVAYSESREYGERRGVARQYYTGGLTPRRSPDSAGAPPLSLQSADPCGKMVTCYPAFCILT